MKSQRSFSETETGKLYLVPTPIGNLEDMTFRAVRMLKEADLIAAEDTRNTQKLLNHFDIHTPQISFHEHNRNERAEQLIQKLLDGETIAQVSDAGMPSISDPGYELTLAAIEHGISVVPLPGPNAGLTALIASGLDPQPFYFYGFLPRKKKEQAAELEELNRRRETFILYESPHRLKTVLQAMRKAFGPERKIVLAREVTKRFEEFLRGTLEEAVAWSKDNEIRGEFCIIVEGNDNPEEQVEANDWSALSVKEHVEQLMNEKNLSSKDAIKEVAKLREQNKRDIYAEYHGI
ncbi:16S rRNA (cytidine(1402)-2'-O)-methyltransferase [Atopococcus tabaci]|uniref:16S rRNA (cytidine(1402)-2'-O)-methyltransferase n=1 Tax=Atopococcus tabaci TaxID=269774 RepID=UPI0003F5862C|nr:16S rRNA (cytidine(1402)-2'-O)-methyltransferase [Atopococcus tabaci]